MPISLVTAQRYRLDIFLCEEKISDQPDPEDRISLVEHLSLSTGKFVEPCRDR